jgi:hypothetical protein
MGRKRRYALLLLTPRCDKGEMTYRLNLYSNAKLISTELVDVSLSQAKEFACSALDHGRAERAELVNGSGSILFQRWAVL